MTMKPYILGIDFGTTSLSVVLIRTDNKQIDKVISRNTNAYIISSDPMIKEQSIEILTRLFNSIMDEIAAMPNIEIQAYGFTGQMHGVIGLDKNNKAVTNLVTWEDRSGEMLLPDGVKVLDKIKSLSGEETLSCGYGVVTLYKWLVIEKRKDICNFCTVADYFAGQLSGKIAMSPTMAHSIGLFDIYSNMWKRESIENLGISFNVFPQIVKESNIIGYKEQNSDSIPVVSAIGDNQASFLGSVLDKKSSMILNVGTGTQISVLLDNNEIKTYSKYIDGFETQLRPYDENSYLMATSFINGGAAYNSLFSFLKESGNILFNLESIDENELWRNMERAARKSIEDNNILEVSPLLARERKNPDNKGEITNITSHNFHLGSLVAGFLVGLAKYYKSRFFPELSQKVECICGSGNGLKKNKLLVEIIEKTFGKPVSLTSYNEEAAVGAALNAAKAIGLIKEESDSRSFLSDLSKTHLK